MTLGEELLGSENRNRGFSEILGISGDNQIAVSGNCALDLQAILKILALHLKGPESVDLTGWSKLGPEEDIAQKVFGPFAPPKVGRGCRKEWPLNAMI